jgi:hypothetical protein
MQIMTKKQFNFNAVLMLLIGSVAFAAGTFMLMAPKQEIDPLALKRQKFTSCMSAISVANMSGTQDVPNNKITVVKPDIQDFKYTLASASFIISECEGFEMQKMCIGSGCDPAGYSMDLIYSENAREKPVPIQATLQNLMKK